MAARKTKVAKFKPSDPEFDYENYPFYWVARLGNRYAQRMEAKLKPLGLTTTGWRVCLILKQQGALSVSEISAHSAVKLSTVTKTVYALEDKGYLTVKRRENDARITEVSITSAGLKLIARVIDQTSDILDRALTGFSESELKNVNGMLRRLFDNLADS